MKGCRNRPLNAVLYALRCPAVEKRRFRATIQGLPTLSRYRGAAPCQLQYSFLADDFALPHLSPTVFRLCHLRLLFACSLFHFFSRGDFAEKQKKTVSFRNSLPWGSLPYRFAFLLLAVSAVPSRPAAETNSSAIHSAIWLPSPVGGRSGPGTIGSVGFAVSFFSKARMASSIR